MSEKIIIENKSNYKHLNDTKVTLIINMMLNTQGKRSLADVKQLAEELHVSVSTIYRLFQQSLVEMKVIDSKSLNYKTVSIVHTIEACITRRRY